MTDATNHTPQSDSGTTDLPELNNAEPLADGSAESPVTFEVFNPDESVGAACNRDGEIIGLHINDDARDNGEIWLAREILRVAHLANLKSRVGLRSEMEANGVLGHTIDAFGLPTQAAYTAAEQDEFRDRA
ncbi:hypothetical protein [Nocardia sp. NPDC057668]|uniref:hypothetical protein n=1 Tax=Nocardia sp. NPDC057668 TaxID=3346202 RepID=UPI0036731AC6